MSPIANNQTNTYKAESHGRFRRGQVWTMRTDLTVNKALVLEDPLGDPLLDQLTLDRNVGTCQ
jgi:hypothetical protein